MRREGGASSIHRECSGNTARPVVAASSAFADDDIMWCANVIEKRSNVAIIRSVPLIERFDDIDLTPIEIKSPGYRASAMVRMELSSNTHELRLPDSLHLRGRCAFVDR